MNSPSEKAEANRLAFEALEVAIAEEAERERKAIDDRIAAEVLEGQRMAQEQRDKESAERLPDGVELLALEYNVMMWDPQKNEWEPKQKTGFALNAKRSGWTILSTFSTQRSEAPSGSSPTKTLCSA